MAAGLPIVATAVGEVPSVVQASFGTLVPAAEPEAMAQALADLLVDPKRRTEMGTHSQRMATERFGFDAWLRSLLELYQGVAQRYLRV